jgi:hypothetical protein
MVQRLSFLLAGLGSADSAERAAHGARELLLHGGLNHQQARAALQEILKGERRARGERDGGWGQAPGAATAAAAGAATAARQAGGHAAGRAAGHAAAARAPPRPQAWTRATSAQRATGCCWRATRSWRCWTASRRARC